MVLLWIISLIILGVVYYCGIQQIESQGLISW